MESEAHSRQCLEVNVRTEMIGMKRSCVSSTAVGVSGQRLGLGSLRDQTGLKGMGNSGRQGKEMERYGTHYSTWYGT